MERVGHFHPTGLCVTLYGKRQQQLAVAQAFAMKKTRPTALLFLYGDLFSCVRLRYFLYIYQKEKRKDLLFNLIRFFSFTAFLREHLVKYSWQNLKRFWHAGGKDLNN